MKNKQRKSTPIVFISSLIVGVLILTGCYLKQKPPGNFTAEGNSIVLKKVKKNHLDQFFSDVKKVDGRAKAHYDMAVYFQKRKKHNLALQDFQKSLQFDPTEANTYNAMGISYDKTGDHKRAIQCYEMAIKLSPDMASAHNNLGYSKMLISDTEGALESYQRAISLDDTNPRYRNNLDMLYAKTGHTNQAEPQLETPNKTTAADLKLNSLLTKSKDFNIGKKHPDISEILKKETNQKQSPFIQSNISSYGIQKNTNDDNLTLSDIVDDVNVRTDADNTEDSVVFIVYEDESHQTMNNHNKTDNIQDTFDAKEPNKIIGKKASRKHLESDSLNQNIEEVNDVPLYAVNIITETRTLTTNVDNSTLELQDHAVPGKTYRESSTQPEIIEVIFKNKAELVSDGNDQPNTKEGHITHKDGIKDEPKSSSISYESVKIIEVGSPKKSSSQLLVAGLNIASKNDQKNIGDIEVLNGNGIRGAARRLATNLKSKGHKVTKVSNARSFDHLSTKILFRTENIDYIFPLLNELPLLIDDSDLLENTNMKTSIRIIIGKDMAKYQ